MSARLDPNPVSTAEARTLAEETFVFGLPLVYIALQIDTNNERDRAGGPRAPMDQFAHFRATAGRVDQVGRRAQRRHAVLARGARPLGGAAWCCRCRRWATATGSCS